MAGRYEGELIVNMLDDGRRVKLVQPFAYIDPANLRWEAPKDAIVDGASIPKILWAAIGGPFEGKYRNASVIHDWYCDRRSRPWKAVHRVFYEAMVTSGVDPLQAKAMYAGVYWGGPRWSETVVHNTDLAEKPASIGFEIAPGGCNAGFAATKAPRPAGKGKRVQTLYKVPLRKTQYDALAARVQAENLSLEDIEGIVDDKTAALTPAVKSIKPLD